MRKNLNILVIFPHPDDSAFFAAGTLARWVAEGHRVTSVCCTSGNIGTLRPDQTKEEVAALREKELRAANAVLGIQETVTLGHSDGGFMEAGALRKELIGLIRKYRPDRLLTLDPWVPYEVHPDHDLTGRMAAEAAAFAAFPLLNPEQLSGDIQPHSPSEVWFMGMLGNAPNCYVDISSSIETKIASALEFEGTLAVLAGMFAPEIDPANVSFEEQRQLAGHADTWLRSMAARIGRKMELPAAEAFYIQPCMPGHFDNMDEILAEMLNEAPARPTVI